MTTSMRAAAFGVRMPDGIVAAYPATLLTAYASPSRLLTLMDPLLPLSVLSRCLSAYAGLRVSMCVKAYFHCLAKVFILFPHVNILFFAFYVTLRPTKKWLLIVRWNEMEGKCMVFFFFFFFAAKSIKHP